MISPKTSVPTWRLLMLLSAVSSLLTLAWHVRPAPSNQFFSGIFACPGTGVLLGPVGSVDEPLGLFSTNMSASLDTIKSYLVDASLAGQIVKVPSAIEVLEQTERGYVASSDFVIFALVLTVSVLEDTATSLLIEADNLMVPPFVSVHRSEDAELHFKSGGAGAKVTVNWHFFPCGDDGKTCLERSVRRHEQHATSPTFCKVPLHTVLMSSMDAENARLAAAVEAIEAGSFPVPPPPSVPPVQGLYYAD